MKGSNDLEGIQLINYSEDRLKSHHDVSGVFTSYFTLLV